MNGIKYRRDDEMKDSGVEWLGIIPIGWDIYKAKYIWKKEKRPLKKHYGVVTCYRDGQVTLRENRRSEGYTFAIKEIGYQGVLKGDLVISAMDAFAGALGISESEGKCSPVYSVCSPLIALCRSYYGYLLKEISNKKYILSLAKGIRERSTDFRYSEFANTMLIYPQLIEQQKIANFLDIKTAQFDSIIAKKEKLIEKLEEAKKSLISEVVTGKVKIVDGKLIERDTSEMKDSGVEWLGMIPKEWESKKLKYLVSLNGIIRGPFGSALKVDSFVDVGYKVYEQKNAIYNNLSLGDSFITYSKFKTLQRFQVHIKDFIVSCSGTIGKIVFLNKLIEPGIINQALMIIRINNILKHEYFNLVFVSEVFQKQITDNTQGSAMKNLVSTSIFKNIKLPVPAKNKQREIVVFLKEKINEIESTIEKANRQIKYLNQAKQSLISEAVTGKIDLQEWEIVEEGEVQ